MIVRRLEYNRFNRLALDFAGCAGVGRIALPATGSTTQRPFLILEDQMLVNM